MSKRNHCRKNLKARRIAGQVRGRRRFVFESLEERRVLTGVEGRIWIDAANNGLQDLNEANAFGAVAEFFGSTNAVVGDSDDVSLGVKQTAADGLYRFDSPPSYPNYFVTFRTPAGFSFALQDINANSNDSIDSDANVTTGRTNAFTLGLNTEKRMDAGLSGAAPAFGWVNTAGGTAIDGGGALVADTEGNTYVVGIYLGSVDFDNGPGTVTLSSPSAFDSVIAKYSSTGALVWIKQVGSGTGVEFAGTIGLDSIGNVIIGGTFDGTVDFNPGNATNNLTSSGQDDIFVTKLDSDGNFIWAKRIGGSGLDSVSKLIVNNTDEITLTGSFRGTVDFDPNSGVFNLVSSGSGDDAYVTKLDANGGLVWAKRFGGTSTESPRSIVQDSAGNLLVTGTFQGTADFDPGVGTTNLISAGIDDAFVSKLDSSGGFIWARRFGGTNSDVVSDVAVDSFGSVYTTGRFIGTSDFDPGASVLNFTSALSFDIFLSKLNSDGSLGWAKQIGGIGDDFGQRLYIDSSANIYSLSRFSSTVDFDPGAGKIELTSNGGTDYAVAKYSTIGNLLWAYPIGGQGSENSASIVVDSAGNILTTGRFQSSVDFDPTENLAIRVSAGSDDYFTSQVNTTAIPEGIFLSNRQVFESSTIGTIVGSFGVFPTDGYTYSFVDGAFSSDNAAFSIVGDSLRTAAIFDFESRPTYTIQVTATNGVSTHVRTFSITVANVNEPPTNIILSNSTVPENSPPGTAVGTIGVADADAGDIHTVSILNNPDGRFRIVGNQLQVAQGLDYELTQQHTLTLRAVDSGGLIYDQIVSVNVSNILQEPLLSGRVWLDADRSGDRTEIETGFAGVTVQLFGSTNTVRGDADDVLLNSKLSDSSGDFSFGGPPTFVSYYLQYVSPAGFEFTTANINGNLNDAVDSDADPNTGRTAVFSLTPTSVVALDAGLAVALQKFGWAVGAGSSGIQERGWAVATDAQGNVYATGAFEGTVDFDPGIGVVSLVSAGARDTFVSKYAPTGELLWAKRLGGGLVDEAHGIAIDPWGNLLITGFFESTNADFDPGIGVFTLASAGNFDTFITKLTSSGDLLWARSIGGPLGGEFPTAIVSDASGNPLISGSFSGVADFDPSVSVFQLSPAGGSDAFVTKLSLDGNFLWVRSWGGNLSDEARDVAVDAVGNVITSGYFASTVDFDPGSAVFSLSSSGSSDAFVSKLDSAGNFIWAKKFGGSGGDSANALTVDLAGDIYTVGNFSSTADFDPGAGVANLVSAGSSDIYVSKLGSTGEYNWAVRFGGSTDEVINDIAIRSDGHLFSIGYFRGTVDFDPGIDVSNISTVGSFEDVFVSELDNAGRFVSVKQVGGSSTEQGMGLALDSFGDLILTGAYSATADFDPGTSQKLLTSLGGLDIFVAKVATSNNKAPTNVTLSSSSVAENSSLGTVVGTVVGTDLDIGDLLTYTLTNNAGKFSVTGNQLIVAGALNFESSTSHNITIRATDANGLYYEKDFIISVTDANEAPTSLTFSNGLTSASIFENTDLGTVVGTMAATDPDLGDTFTYSLVTGTGDIDNGAFSISGSNLTANSTFDFETKNQYSILVRTTDAGGLFYEQSFTIDVTNVNETPSTLSLSANTIAENNTANALIGVFTSTDPDAGDGVTYSLVAGDGSSDNSAFTVTGNGLFINSSSDYEAKNVYHIRARATDTAGLFLDRTLTITVTDVNEAPIALNLSSSSIAENNPVDAVVGTFSSLDPDLGDSFSYSLVAGAGDIDNNAFTISGNSLAANSTFDFETKNSYNIRIRTTDAGQLNFERSFTISVTQVNESPIALSLSPTTIAENNLANAIVGAFNSTDPNSGDSFIYSLVTGNGDGDNGAFSISGPDLLANAPFNFEAKQDYSIRVRTTDAGGLFFEQEFTINVTNVNESPFNFALPNSTIPENNNIGQVIGSFTISDEDAGDSITYSLVSGSGDTDNGAVTINGAELTANVAFDFDVKSTYSILVHATDAGGLFVEKNFTITIADVNESPTAISLSATSLAENNLAGALIGTFSTTDSDLNETFVYSFVSGVNDTDNGLFTLSGDQLTTNVAFDFEAKPEYTIRVRSTDSDGLFFEQDFTIQVTDVNEAPMLVNPIADFSVIEGTTTTDIDLAQVFSDVDDSILGYTVQVGNEDLLTTSINGTVLTITYVTGSFGSSTITVTATDSGNLSISDDFVVTVEGIVPQILVSDPLDGYSGVVGQQRFLRFSTTDLASSEQVFTYEVQWGDGSPLETLTGPATIDASHTFTSIGFKTVQVRVIDEDNNASEWVTKSLNILRTELQGTELAVGGNTVDDTLAFTPGSSAPSGQLSLNGTSLGSFGIPANGVKFFSNGGSDTLTMNGTSGNDTFTTDGATIVWNGSATWTQPVRLNAVDTTKLRVQSLAGNDEIIVSSGTAEVDGGTGTDRIMGPNSGGLWNVTGAGLGTLNGLSFAGIEALLGGSGNDSFEFTNTGAFAGIVDGNGGQDTLSYSARTTAVAISLLANTATSTGGVRNIEQFVGSSATTDTFTASNIANAWQLTGEKSGSLNLTFGFSGFETLKGGTGTDSFAVESAASSFVSVDGGSGTDSLNYSGFASAIQVDLANRSAPGITSFVGVESLIGSSASDLLIGPNSTNAWTINGLNSGALGTTLFQSFESLQGGTGNDTVTLTATGALSGAVDGATGVDTLIGPTLAGVNVDWTIIATGGGVVNSVSFLGMENLTGGTSLDRFLITDSGSVVGTINGGSSPLGQRDQLNYAAVSTPISVNLAANVSTNVGLISGIEEVVGTTASADAIRGANVVNAWSITAADTGTVGSLRFVDIENLTGGILADSFSLVAGGSVRGTIVGGDGTDTALGPTPGVGSVIDWNVTSAGGGEVLGTDFAEIENLTGGNNLDRFTFSETGSVTGTINGGSSGVGERDQLNYSLTTGPIVVDLAAKLQPRAGLLVGIEEIVGTSSSQDEIRGANAANAWSLTGIDTGTVGSLRFVDVENLTGGTLADSFSLVAGGSVRGTMRGGTGIDTLIGANANNVWQVQGENTGLINAIVYQEIENITGGSATDTFVMSASGTVSGVLNAGAGTTDRLDYSVQSSNLIVNLQTRSLPGGGTFAGVEQIAGSFSGGDLLVGPNATTSWSLSGVNSGTAGAIQFSGFESVQGGSGNDTFTLGVAGSLAGVVVGGGGTDTLVGPSPGQGSVTEWNINSAGGGNLRDVDFEGIENLTGGSNLDRFLFSATGAVTGTINGGASGAGERDQVSYAAVTGPITIDLQAKTQPRATSLVGIEELVGTDASDELRGQNAANTWSLTAANTGTVGTFRFVGFESLVGGTLADTFSFVPGGTAVSVAGGDGVDTILGPNTVTNWNLQSTGQGTIGASSFAAIENLTGGTAVDTFNIGPSGSLAGALNGGTAGRNVLSYAAWSSPVTVNLSTRVASAITGQVTNFTVIQGGDGNDQLTGNSTLGTILLGMFGDDSLVGVSGRDIMIGGFGSDILTGGNGDDLLIASATAYDNDFVSLSSIFDEWSNTSRNYQTRVNNLRGIGAGLRLNGDLFLQNSPTPTLYADPGSVDQLFGGVGQDWFITDDAADITDQVLTGLLAELRDEVVAPPT